MILAHGFGCDQSMWRHLVPAFENDFRLVLFDYVGHGQADASAFDRTRYATLDGYADDVLEICEALAIRDAVFVGHSVSAMIGILAAQKDPDALQRAGADRPFAPLRERRGLVGGFTREDIDGLLDFLDSNLPGLVEHDGAGDHGQRRSASLERGAGEQLLPHRSRDRQAFRARHIPLRQPRGSAGVNVPTLILQCSQDAIAPEAVGRYVAAHIPGSTFVQLRATGHCPHLSDPDETIAAIRSFLDAQRSRAMVPADNPTVEDSAEELFEHAPCGYLIAHADGRSSAPTRPSAP